MSEEHTERVLATVSDLTAHFPRLFLTLPEGTQRIAIEGERSEKKLFCALSLDDLTIMDCDQFGKTQMKLISRYHWLMSIRCAVLSFFIPVFTVY